MNSQITLFSDLAELNIYQSNRRPTGTNSNQQNQQLQTRQDFNFDGATTKFDRLLTTIFSSIPNNDIELIISQIEEELADEFGTCIAAESNSDIDETESKIQGLQKVKEAKDKLKVYDGLDISIIGYSKNDVIHQKIVFSDIDTKETVAYLSLTDNEDKNYDFYVAMYLAMLIPKFGRKVLTSLFRQLINTDVASTSIYDRVSRQMNRNPYAKIAHWMVAMKFVNDTYIPVMAGHLLVDDKLSLQSLYTILVSGKLPKEIITLYEFMTSNGSIDLDDDTVEKGPFRNRVVNENGKIMIQMIAPSGLDLRRTLNIRHRVAKKRSIRQVSFNFKYRDLVRNFGSMQEELAD